MYFLNCNYNVFLSDFQIFNKQKQYKVNFRKKIRETNDKIYLQMDAF